MHPGASLRRSPGLSYPCPHRGEGCLGGDSSTAVPTGHIPLYAALVTGLTGTQGRQMASQDFSFLESSLQGTPGPSLVLPRGAAAANTTLPSSRGPSTCSCTPISSSCGPPPAVALPLLKLQSAALLTPDCRVPTPVSESAGLGEDPKCCLTMNHTLSSTGHHAGGSPGELAKSCSRLGPRHSGPFNLDGPGESET